MNTNVTQCPECATRFRVSDIQLEAHQGMVRCGRCHQVFNAREHLHDNTPSPQLSLPIEEPSFAETKEPPVPEELDFSNRMPAPEPTPQPTTLAQQVEFVEELTDEVVFPLPKERRWPWLVGAALLLLVLCAQLAYLYRVDIAAELPGTKPLLESYCELLNCTVPLPRHAELMRIESSELEADAQQSNLITLHALLHNSAAYAQAYPELELTLLDLDEKVIARRVFHPADYVKNPEEEKTGIAANREASIKIKLDTTELKPSGYKLFLFYPQ